MKISQLKKSKIMEQKRAKEIIQLIIERIQGGYGPNYICILVRSLHLSGDIKTKEERNEFLDLLHSHKPCKAFLPELTKHSSWINKYSWWRSEEKEQRILYLNTLLKHGLSI